MMKWGNFSSYEKIYAPYEILSMLQKFADKDNFIRNNKKVTYYNIPCSFDIETTSFFRSTGNENEKEKAAIMYEWTLGINGGVCIGRTWDEFIKVYNAIISYFELDINHRLIVYVHNLSFEFQFIRKWIEWENVFSIDTRKPIYALTKTGVEFRCSYLLSGYSLAKLGENLHKYKVQKLTGDLDYKLVRHSKTPLTEKEIGYCVNDVRLVMSYIQELIENDGDITKIPLTKTGYVRNFCRNNCLYEGSHKKNGAKYIKYHALMQSMQLTPDEYSQLKRAFQGGFTHANAQYSGLTMYNVRSFDFISSYPYCMVSEKFPMSSSVLVKIKSEEQLKFYLKKYCCLFDVEINGMFSKTFIEHPLSSSKCYKKLNCIEDNGRVVSAERLLTTLTELDFSVLKTFYTWDKIKIYNFRIYKKDYLPLDMINSILKLYANKTKLKGVEDKEVEYLKSKEMINAVYGMTVTDICREDIKYSESGEWVSEKPDLEKSIHKYNRSKRRFLFYPWGVWVTAYARRNLFTGIYNCGGDYIYSDTDSIKVQNSERHNDYIEKYNNAVLDKLEKSAKSNRLNFSDFKPKTIKGKEKILGVWDDEGAYTKFKTLGAKRYITEKDNTISITVSGLNKKIATPYLVKTYGNNVFDMFDNDLYIPSEYTGKNTHTYIDYEIHGELVDYLGNKSAYYEKSGIHLESADYSLSIYSAYADYLKGVREHEN